MVLGMPGVLACSLTGSSRRCISRGWDISSEAVTPVRRRGPPARAVGPVDAASMRAAPSVAFGPVLLTASKTVPDPGPDIPGHALIQT